MLGNHDATETARIMYAAKPRPLSEEHEATQTQGTIHAAEPRPLSLSGKYDATETGKKIRDPSRQKEIIHAAKPRPLSEKYEQNHAHCHCLQNTMPQRQERKYETHRDRGNNICRKATPTVREVLYEATETEGTVHAAKPRPLPGKYYMRPQRQRG